MSTNKVYRIYVEKKPEFSRTRPMLENIRGYLQISGLQSIRILERYDVQGIDDATFQAASVSIFAEPPVDNTYTALPQTPGAHVFATEYLPGQYDQRADSCIHSAADAERAASGTLCPGLHLAGRFIHSGYRTD